MASVESSGRATYYAVYMLVTIIGCFIPVNGNTNLTATEVGRYNCPPWFSYNSTVQECQCFQQANSLTSVKCTDSGALLAFGYCMTYNEDKEATFLGLCPSFKVDGRNVSERRFITLPANISELNDYMCGPLNRQGLICSECIDGFAPSVTSIGYQCADCTNAWYGVPLYLLLQFIPVTVFYLLILYFKISLTCAPMTGFILYCQLVALTYKQHDPLRLNLTHKNAFTQYYLGILASLCGIWNLDFFYYILPPFCVSPHLKNIHILFFNYFTSFYTFCLIAITWICISLYSRNCQPFVSLWLKLKKYFVSVRQEDMSRTIIDVFATFLLLSYTKLLLTSIVILQPSLIRNTNGLPRKLIPAVDPSIQYFSDEHIPFVLIAIVIFVVIVLLPAFLLALYPVRRLRSLLYKCGLGGHSKAAINIFVEKFYSCYRDGLDGGKDMRSFASLYFFIRIAGFFGIALFPTMSLAWLFQVFLFGGCSLLISLVRPYKKAYMNVTDSLILCSIAIFALLYLLYIYAFQDSPLIYLVSIIIILTLPLIWFTAFISVKLYTIGKRHNTFCNKKKSADTPAQQNVSDGTTNDLELPDRVLNPELYNNHTETIQNNTSESFNSHTPQRAVQIYLSEP